jgi:hypothetical protein
MERERDVRDEWSEKSVGVGLYSDIRLYIGRLVSERVSVLSFLVCSLLS